MSGHNDSERQRGPDHDGKERDAQPDDAEREGVDADLVEDGRVALAHDASWMLQNNEKDRDPVLFGLLGDDFDEHVRGRVARDEPF